MKKEKNLNTEFIDQFFPLVIPKKDGARLLNGEVKHIIRKTNLSASHNPRIDGVHFHEISLSKEEQGNNKNLETKKRKKGKKLVPRANQLQSLASSERRERETLVFAWEGN